MEEPGWREVWDGGVKEGNGGVVKKKENVWLSQGHVEMGVTCEEEGMQRKFG